MCTFFSTCLTVSIAKHNIWIEFEQANSWNLYPLLSRHILKQHIELSQAPKVLKFEENRFTFVAVIAWKQSVTDSQTDRQTNKPKLESPV